MINWLVAATLLLLSPCVAKAGTVTFQLSLTDNELVAINQGDSTAFYPSVFELMADGHWQPLSMKAPTAELVPGQRLQLAWVESGNTALLEQMQAVMVSFFDQAGVRFGQISFFHEPPQARETLRAGYGGEKLLIEPPGRTSSIRSSWVLWSREEGIASIRHRVRFQYQPTPAQHIEWRNVAPGVVSLDTGAGKPAAILVHETDRGNFIQRVPGGAMQGREQRAAWLESESWFYRAAQLALAAGAALTVLSMGLRRVSRRGA